MITLHVTYIYRGKRTNTSRTLNDRSEVAAELDMLDRCGYDNIDIVDIDEDGTLDSSIHPDDEPF